MMLLVVVVAAGPASAGPPGLCCLCTDCDAPPEPRCFDVSSPQECVTNCVQDDCFFGDTEAGPCAGLPACEVAAEPAPAPTMGEWGLAATGALLAALGARSIRRRRRAPS